MQELKLRIAGLHTLDNELSSAVPEGALSVADNVVIDAANIAQPRRGYNRSSAAFSNASHRSNRLFFYQDRLFAHYSANLLAYYSTALDSTSSNFTGSGTWTAISGTYAPDSGTEVRTAEANENLYFTSAAGVYKMDAYNSTPRLAGAYKGLDVTASIVNVTGNWLTTANKVTYRVIWGYKDGNNNLILGAPSQREIISNTAGAARAVRLRITIPDGVTTDWFYQVYRSSMISTGSTSDPSDEMQLVYEANPAGADISAKYVQIDDITPDELRGSTIYTAATQEGLVNQNEMPPAAKDIAVFKNVMFYANTTSRHRFTLTLLAVSLAGTAGLHSGDTVTIGGIVYTAGAAENVGTRTFALSADASAGIRIRDTALSLIRIINQASSSVVTAYYSSIEDQLPGKITIEAEDLGSAAFTVASSRDAAWSPALATDNTSSNDRFKHGVAFSKNSEPEAVPLANVFKVGSAEDEILRIVPLRDSLFIFKQHGGIYRLSGEDASSFRVDLFDSTTRLLAADSVAVLNNQIFCLTDQGVVAVTDAGVQVKSRPIESTLTQLLGLNPTILRSGTFGIAYETERKYILFVPTDSSDTTPTQAFVYNTFTDTWTRWILSKTCGAVNPANDKLYLGDADSAYTNEERKSLTYKDYADYGFTTNLTAVSGTTLTIESSDNISVGDIVYESDTKYAIVSDVDTVAGTVTTATAVNFTLGSVTILQSIATRIAWVPITASNPGMLKHYREASVLFKSDFTGTAMLGFKSDASPSQETETLTGTEIGQWGLFAWGGVPWGGGAARRPIRVYVPRNKQRCSQLTVEFQHSTAWAAYQLTGISVIANAGSERVAV